MIKILMSAMTVTLQIECLICVKCLIVCIKNDKNQNQLTQKNKSKWCPHDNSTWHWPMIWVLYIKIQSVYNLSIITIIILIAQACFLDELEKNWLFKQMLNV